MYHIRYYQRRVTLAQATYALMSLASGRLPLGVVGTGPPDTTYTLTSLASGRLPPLVGNFGFGHVYLNELSLRGGYQCGG